MSRATEVTHEFVEFIPDDLAPNTIYVSMEYGTAAHSCLCGCGHRVITPITPTDWRLTYDGDSISLHPSVGNWSFPCQSHYIIKEGRAIWAEQWSQARIEAGRGWDKRRKRRHYAGDELIEHGIPTPATAIEDEPARKLQPTWTIRSFVTSIAQRLRKG